MRAHGQLMVVVDRVTPCMAAAEAQHVMVEYLGVYVCALC